MSTAVADWPKFLTKLRDREEVAERTMAFRFEKPAGFKFTPGQFMEITLLNPPETDSEGNSRAFSIARLPRKTSSWWQPGCGSRRSREYCARVPLGTQVQIDGPFGDLRLHNDSSRAAVILSGGIGITPFRSILWHAAKQTAPSHFSFLFQPQTGRCSIS